MLWYADVMDKRNEYRFDRRSRAQFQEDIKEGNRIERELLDRWLLTVGSPSFEDTGCGNDGEYLNFDRVSTSPDFAVDGYGSVEVKFCRPTPAIFHLKLGQLRQYARYNASILMVLGVEGSKQIFTLISPAEINLLMKECPHVHCSQFGGKAAIQVPVRRLRWQELPKAQRTA